ncbi:MAG: SDR family NAD(P)-dependent oxidoreductase [Candidatus Promineifilaceae bacterium]|jgi:NAD(P)-dependent dehydrogenase (short-subunit alcohol dehydrogenase family)
MSELKGKVALITGAGRRNGIGVAVARRLAEGGADIVISDICAAPSDLPHGGNAAWEELQENAAELAGLGVRALPLRADVTSGEDVASMIAATRKQFGRLDILVNNAGAIIGPAPVRYMAEEAWRRMLEINATGIFLCCHHALPLMIEADQGGRIINMSSIAAVRPRIFMSAYAASKAAVIAMTKSLAQEVGEFGITANAVLPGDINTGMKQWGMQMESLVTGTTYDDVVGDLESRIPIGRIGSPQDVADLVYFLASDEAKFITGQAINLTGGRELT